MKTKKIKKKKYEGRGRKITSEVPELSSRKGLNDKIIEIYRDGGNLNEVEEYLTSIGRKKSIRSDIHLANVQIKSDAKLERETLINTHVKRYEKIYKNNINAKISDFSQFPENIARLKVIDSYMIAMDALIAKEKVLGLHTKNFRVQLNK